MKLASVVTSLSVWLACCGTPVLAQYPIASKYAFACQDKSSKALAVFVRAKAHCITSCQRRARQGKNPFSDCAPPTFGGETAVCILDAQKGAEGKATLGFIKGCTAGCPACFSGGDCSAAAADQVSFREALVDALDAQIYCSTGGNANQNTCRERVASAISGYARKHTKCYRDCFVSAQKGKIPAANCLVPAIDPKAAGCLALGRSNAMTAIDKGCFRPRAESLPCYDGTTAPDTSAGWVDAAEFLFDFTIPTSFCGSPSGAFVE